MLHALHRKLLSVLIATVFSATLPSHAWADDPLPAIPAPGQEQTVPLTPEEHQRGEEQTYLTFPEWYLVFSPDEYARFIAHSSPSDFPFFGEIGQFWSSYHRIVTATPPQSQPNIGYHVMILVIGGSTTVEYTLRSAYENTLGRLAELTKTHGMTEEERFAVRVAQEYVDFIRVAPWYDFDFAARLKGLWLETSLLGPDMVRKWERKLALSLEYGIKAVYGLLIRLGTHATYEQPILATVLVVDHLPPADTKLPELQVLKTTATGQAVISVPRYEAFMRYATELAKSGVHFQEIAGNRSDILVSVLADAGWQLHEASAKLLFEQPVLTEPSRKRIVFTVPVAMLADVLKHIDAGPAKLEHVFDY